MPLSTHIAAIANQLPGAKTNIYGTANEINYKADGAKNANQFFVCLFPLSPIGITLQINGSAINTFDLYMEFLYITKFERTTADNEELVMQALNMSNLFLAKLREYRVGDNNYFKWGDKDMATARPVYNKYDVNTTGVGLTFKVKLMEPVIAPQC